MSARRIVRGVAAIAAMAAIIGGVPLVLIRVAGSPVPAHVPDWQHLSALLSQRDDTGSFFLALIRDLTWLAWLIFSGTLVVELQAALRGRLAPRLHLGAVQLAAARLAAIAALSFTTPAGLSFAAAGLPSAAALPAATHARDAVALRTAFASDDQRAWSVTVRPGDCLWTLAAHYLGAGDRYTEIADLNIGHQMDDGVIFTNPSLIYPGWRLEMPGQPPDAAPAMTGRQDPAAGQHTGHDTAHTRFRGPHPAASHSPDGIQAPGGAPAPTPAETPPQAAGGHPAASDAVQPSSRDDKRAIAEGAAAAMLAGGVLASLEALRRRQRSRRGRGRRITLPAADAAQRVERMLQAAHSYYDRPALSPPVALRLALQELAASLRASGRDMPECVGVHVLPDPPQLEILLARPAGRPPAPFTLAPGRQEMCWQLDVTPLGPRESPAGTPSQLGDVMPGLFTVGTTTSGYLLLDLEIMRVAVVRGQPATTDQFIATAAAEFATNQWSGWYDLVVAGPFAELAELDRAEHCDSVADALRLLRLRRRSIDGRIGTADRAPGRSGLRDRRLARPDDEDWGLTLLVSRIPPTSAELDELVGLADDRGGIAVLVPSPADRAVEAPATIDLAGSSRDPQSTATVRLGILGAGHEIVVRPATLTAADYEQLGSLFAAAATVEDVAADEPPYAEYVAPAWLPRAARDAAHRETVTVDGPAFPDAGEADGGDARSDGAEDGDEALEPPRAELPGRADGNPSAEVPVADPPSAVPVVDAAAEPGNAGGGSAAPAPLRVGILGAVEITGADRAVSAQQTELVVALALTAPDGLSAAALATLLGTDPSQPRPVAAVRQLITRTRRALGLTAGGGYYIRHDGGQYSLSGAAQLDWTEFTRLAQAGLDLGDTDRLAAAIALVRGRPLAGSRYWWIDAAVIETINAQIVDTGLLLAESLLAAGDPAGATAAARAGLQADPAAEQLCRALMRAEYAAGNVAGLSAAWAECHQAIQAVDPGGSPQRETTELYRALTGGGASLPVRMAG